MTLRNKLIDIALLWQENFGVAPSITSAISEYDAAMLIGMPENEYSEYKPYVCTVKVKHRAC